MSKHWSVHRNWTLIGKFSFFPNPFGSNCHEKVLSSTACSSPFHEYLDILGDISHMSHMTEYSQTGNVLEYSPIFKTARVAKNNWRIITTIASIWRGITLGHLSFDIICSSKLAVFIELSSGETVLFSEQTMSLGKYLSNIFVPNGGYCLYIRYLVWLYFVVVFLTILLKQHNFIKFYLL